MSVPIYVGDMLVTPVHPIMEVCIEFTEPIGATIGPVCVAVAVPIAYLLPVPSSIWLPEFWIALSTLNIFPFAVLITREPAGIVVVPVALSEK